MARGSPVLLAFSHIARFIDSLSLKRTTFDSSKGVWDAQENESNVQHDTVTSGLRKSALLIYSLH